MWLWVDIQVHQQPDIQSFVQQISRRWKREKFELFLIITWHYGRLETTQNMEEKGHGLGIFLIGVGSFWQIFKRRREDRINFMRHVVACAAQWQLPSQHAYKINVDAGVIRGRGRSRIGVVVRDEHGNLKYAAATIKQELQHHLELNYVPFESWIRDWNSEEIPKFTVETDYQQALNLIKQMEEDGMVLHIRRLLHYI
ncbi:hypothetical protein CsatB_011372 [Cannabis sativa]